MISILWSKTRPLPPPSPRPAVRTALVLALALAGAAGAGCLGSSLGVDGGASVLASRFPGIGSVQVISPTSVTIKWKPVNGYTTYNVYTSAQDAPVGSSVFSELTIKGLKPGTTYAFSVAGVKTDGSQDGIGKQVQASTWNHFVGPTSAGSPTSSSVRLAWTYHSGPTFQVFVNANTPPSSAQLAGSPTMTTTSNNGATVAGLLPNTKYYFAVTAKYPDSTTSLDSLIAPTSTISAQYAASQFGAAALPAVTSASSFLTTENPAFNVSGAPATFVTSFFTGGPLVGALNTPCPAVVSGGGITLLASRAGNGVATGSVPLALPINNISVQIRDPLLQLCAYATLSGIATTPSLSSLVPTVYATTTTSLTPLPLVIGPGQHLGNFPTFTVSGALPTYKTTLYNADPQAGAATAIGSVNGNGSITTLPSVPLARGLTKIYPVVTASGQTAYLDPVSVVIRGLESGVMPGPNNLNGSQAASPYMGWSTAVGDYNCDGYQDLAVGMPKGAFSTPTAAIAGPQDQGAVAVYYGSPTGLIGLNDRSGATPVAPSGTPTGTNPLLIVSPSTTAYSLQSINFGFSLTSGNFAKHQVGINKCSDLAVGAPGDQTPLGQNTGSVYVYYASSAGLQVTPAAFNSVTCALAGSTNCSTGKYAIDSSQPFNSHAYNYGTFGWSLAAGDFNGDGWDDLAVGAPMVNDSSAAYNAFATRPGAVLLFYGTDNGISPFSTPIKMPIGSNCNGGTCTSYSQFGHSLAFGYVSDATVAPFTDTIAGGPSAFRKKDLIIGVPELVNNISNGGGFMWVKGTANLSANLDATGHLLVASVGAQYQIIQPAQCNSASGVYRSTHDCAISAAAADVNQDGWDDIIIGAPNLYSIGGTYIYQGGIFVYYGNNSTGPQGPAAVPVNDATTCLVDNAPTGCAPQLLTLADARNYWYTGIAVANFGDLNGDGYPEVGVGANGAIYPTINDYSYRGAAYALYGGARGLTSAGATLFNTSPKRRSYMGSSLVAGNFRNITFGAGACAGKKCNDVVVGAPGEAHSALTYNQGITHFFRNDGSGFAGTVTADNGYVGDIKALPTNSSFEDAMIAGDINGDGYADVISHVRFEGPAEAFLYYVGPVARQARYALVVYYGGPNGLIRTDSSGRGPAFIPAEPGAPQMLTDLAFNTSSFDVPNFALHFGPAGDTNGDGYADVMASATISGMFLFFGSSSGLVAYAFSAGSVMGTPPSANPGSALDPRIITTSYTGPDDNEQFTAGDFNADGYSDMAFIHNVVSGNGVYVVYGSVNGPVTGGALKGPDDPAYAAEPNPNNKAVRTPACTVIAGNTICRPFQICNTNFGSYCTTSPSPSHWGEIGAAQYTYNVVNGGDLDKDGTDDLVLGSLYADSGAPGFQQGGVMIYYGSSTGIQQDRRVRLTIPPKYGAADPVNRRWMGYGHGYGDIVRAGDINGDGINDLVITASYEAVGATAQSYSGAGYVIYGINGGYKAAGGICPGAVYPCQVTMVNPAMGFTPDYNPTHLVENLDNSCDPVSHACNPMRFWAKYPTISGTYFGAGAVGAGDATGDGLADVAITSFRNAGVAVLFSGSLSGLYVSPAPTTQPTCANGLCPPTQIGPDLTAPFNGFGTNTYWTVRRMGGNGDIDKDGRKDFFLGAYWVNEPVNGGYANGGLLIFR